MAYQTIDTQSGASKSREKLEKLRLPNMEGKRMLDLGCNEGFFCGVALEQRASRVVGVDSNAEAIEKAKQRYPEAMFLCQSWMESIEGTFDVILHASAFHYVTDKRGFLRHVYDLLSEDGVFVLESGIIEDPEPKEVEVTRARGTMKHLTRPLLFHLLDDFAVREIGRSVPQSGDPVPRSVFHCNKYKQIVLLCTGESWAGKTELARRFGNMGIRTISVDKHIYGLRKMKQGALSPLILQQMERTRSILALTESIVEAGLIDELCESIVDRIRHIHPMVLIEGYSVADSRISDVLIERLGREGSVIWDVSRIRGGEIKIVDAPNAIRLWQRKPDHIDVEKEKYCRLLPRLRKIVLHAGTAKKPRSAIGWILNRDGRAVVDRFISLIHVPAKAKRVRLTVHVFQGDTRNEFAEVFEPNDEEVLWDVKVKCRNVRELRVSGEMEVGEGEVVNNAHAGVSLRDARIVLANDESI